MKIKFGLLGRLRLPAKLGLLGAITLVLVTVPFYQYYTESQGAIDFARSELSGVPPAQDLIKVIRLTGEHAGLAATVVSGMDKAAAARTAKEAEVNRALTTLDAQIKSMGDPTLTEGLEQARREWIQASADSASSGDSRRVLAAHAEATRKFYTVLDRVLDWSKLSLDPDAHTYHLIQVGLVSLPSLNDLLERAGARIVARMAEGTKAAPAADARAAMELRDHTDLAVLAELAQDRHGDVAGNLAKVYVEAPDLKARLESRARPTLDGSRKLIDMVRQGNAGAQGDPERVWQTYGQILEPQWHLTDAVVGVLDGALRDKISGLETHQRLLVTITAMLVALGLGIGWLIMRSVTGPVRHLQDVMQRLRAGDSSVRANLTTQDEVGDLARHFDEMVDEREMAAARLRQENDQLNESVLNLLQGVAQLSRKDLTVKVPVAEDVTGAVADALNLLTRETAKVLREVSEISADVTGASMRVKQQSDQVSLAADAERLEVDRAAEELGHAADAMRLIAELAQSSNKSADAAIRSTAQALLTVQATVGGIGSTRDTIRETEKRIKRLGERSQEISGVVNLINTIAERTHILALNAAMHAASAGEAGRGFAVVADEVQRLAENARQATAQISTLVNNIQVETADTVTTMNTAISQVVEGSRLAEQAGEQMKHTQETTAELVASVQQIAIASQEQAQLSGLLLQRAGQIKKSTEQTSGQLKEQTEQTDNLVEYARNLLGTVRVFKLPD